MTEPSRYAVPLHQLDQVHVAASEQVEVQDPVASPAVPESWGGALLPGRADGGGSGYDGDGD